MLDHHKAPVELRRLVHSVDARKGEARRVWINDEWTPDSRRSSGRGRSTLELTMEAGGRNGRMDGWTDGGTHFHIWCHYPAAAAVDVERYFARSERWMLAV